VLEKEAALKIKTAKSLEMLNDRASHSTQSLERKPQI